MGEEGRGSDWESRRVSLTRRGDEGLGGVREEDEGNRPDRRTKLKGQFSIAQQLGEERELTLGMMKRDSDWIEVNSGKL